MLLTHVLRSMESAIEDETGATVAESVIDIEIDGDHERFSTASNFHAHVTQDALRHFSRIAVRAQNEGACCDLTLTWLPRSWRTYGKPRTAAHVNLSVKATPDAATERIFDVLLPPVRRGTAGGDRGREMDARGLLNLTFFAGIISAGYLLNVRNNFVPRIALPISLVIGIIATRWLFPALEVVPSEDMRRRRVLRFVGPIVVSVIPAGVTKKLYRH